MDRRYRIRFRLAPGQVASEAIRATSPAEAIKKALQLYGPNCDPIYMPRARRARKASPVQQLLDNLWN